MGTGVPSGLVSVMFVPHRDQPIGRRCTHIKAAQLVVAAGIETGERRSHISAVTLDVRKLHAIAKDVTPFRVGAQTFHRDEVLVLHHRGEIANIAPQAREHKSSGNIRSETRPEDGWADLVVRITQRNRAGVNAFQGIGALDLAAAEGERLEEVSRSLAEGRDGRLIPAIGQAHTLEGAAQRIADGEIQPRRGLVVILGEGLLGGRQVRGLPGNLA